MPTNYYKPNQLNTLSQEQLGFEEKDIENLTLIRTLIIVAEIGLSFIPGIGVAAETAIGLTGGAINQVLDVTTGSTSVFNTVINFAAPLIGGNFVARANKSISTGAISSAKSLEGVLESFPQSERIQRIIKAGIASSPEEATKILESVPILASTSLSSERALNNGRNALIDKLKSSNIKISRREGRALIERLASAKDQLEQLGNSLKADVLTQTKILKTVGFETEEIKGILDLINNSGLSSKQKYSAILGYVRNINLLTSRRYDFPAFGKALQAGELLIGEAYQLPLARQITNLSNKAFQSSNIGALKSSQKIQTSDFISRFVDAAKRPSSRAFNDYIVQPTQAVFDANDAGRAPIEWLYRKLKNTIRNTLKKSQKAIKGAKNVQDLFAKSGGILVDSSWILGYKVINKAVAPGVPQLTQIVFNPRATYSKQPVYVFATVWELERFVLSPGHFYLNHWAYSKGGRNLELGGIFSGPGATRATSRAIGSILGFVNVPMLKNVLSLVSNIVENVSDMKEGVWTKEWVGKFVGSLKRVGINRSVRLFTREGISRGLAFRLSTRLSYSIGRELQRIGTSTLSQVLNNLASKTAKGERKKVTKGLTKGALLNTFGVGIKSNLRRALRNQRGTSSVTLQTLAAQRKISQVNRLPNAVVPKRPYKGIKL